MTREDRAYAWVDRQVDKLRSTDARIIRASKKTDRMLDLLEKAKVAKQAGDNKSIAGYSKKYFRNHQRAHELMAAGDKEGNMEIKTKKGYEAYLKTHGTMAKIHEIKESHDRAESIKRMKNAIRSASHIGTGSKYDINKHGLSVAP